MSRKSKQREKLALIQKRTEKIATLNLEIGKKLYYIVSPHKVDSVVNEYVITEGTNEYTGFAAKAVEDSYVYPKTFELTFGWYWFTEDAWYYRLFLTRKEAESFLNDKFQEWKKTISTRDSLLSTLFTSWLHSYGDDYPSQREQEEMVRRMEEELDFKNSPL